jgi:hypothetical protein
MNPAGFNPPRRTCHPVGLDGTDGDDDGSTTDRSAVQWFRLPVGAGGLTYVEHGRINDPAASNPYWYYYPSLNVRCAGCGCTAGDVAVGFSGSKATEYIGAFWLGRKANGTWMNRPVLVQAGRGAYGGGERWGDYSATSMDPGDDSFWTIQEYADPAPSSNLWGTWIARLRVNP